MRLFQRFGAGDGLGQRLQIVIRQSRSVGTGDGIVGYDADAAGCPQAGGDVQRGRPGQIAAQQNCLSACVAVSSCKAQRLVALFPVPMGEAHHHGRRVIGIAAAQQKQGEALVIIRRGGVEIVTALVALWGAQCGVLAAAGAGDGDGRGGGGRAVGLFAQQDKVGRNTQLGAQAGDGQGVGGGLVGFPFGHCLPGDTQLFTQLFLGQSGGLSYEGDAFMKLHKIPPIRENGDG